MPIINRDNDSTQQRDTFGIKYAAATGVAASYQVVLVPYTATAVSGAVHAGGVTGTPTVQFAVRRNLAAGVTVFTTAFAASQSIAGNTGPFGISFVQGASFQLTQGDVICVNVDGVTELTGSIVLRKTQDIAKHWGI